MKWLLVPISWVIRSLRDWLTPAMRVVEVEGDCLPALIPTNCLIHLIDDGESWSAGMLCPCGCKDILELMLLPVVKPRWDLKVDKRGRPTLSPSVWRTAGCRSHFWLRDGKVKWCPRFS